MHICIQGERIDSRGSRVETVSWILFQGSDDLFYCAGSDPTFQEVGCGTVGTVWTVGGYVIHLLTLFCP